MRGRTDLKHYLQGSLRMRNFRQLAQGGITTRPGTDFIATLPSYGRAVPFVVSETQEYIFVFTEFSLEIWGAPEWDVKLQTLVTPYTEQQCRDMDFTQSGDTMLTFHESIIQQKIVRTSPTTFTIEDISYGVNKDQTRIYQPYHKFVAADVHLVFNGANYQAGTSVTCGAYTNNGATNYTTLWNPDHVGKRFRVLDDGDSIYKEFEVTAIHPAGALQDATVTLKSNFTLTAATLSLDWGEPMYSELRGYASTGAFRESRLWMNGGAGRPNGVVASRLQEFFDFELGTALDDEAIDFSIATTQVKRVEYIVPGRDLTFMCDGAELYTSVADGEAITPGNMNAKPQTYFGSKRVKPWVFDGAVLFAQRKGKNIREYHYKDINQSYTSSSVSILAGHLVDNPVDSTVLTSGDFPEQYAFFVMSNGSMAVFHSIREEETRGWSLWFPGVSDPGLTSEKAVFNNSTVSSASVTAFISQLDLFSSMTAGDKFLSVAAVNDSLFVVTRRRVGGTSVYSLERFNQNRYFDAARTKTEPVPTRTFTGLSSYAGHSVSVRSRDTFLGLHQISALGILTLPVTVEAQVQIQVGLPFLSYFTPMPFDAATRGGALTGKKRRISHLLVELYDTLALQVNSDVMLLRGTTDSMSSQPVSVSGPQPFRQLGYSRDPTVNFVLDEPMRATILSIQAELAH